MTENRKIQYTKRVIKESLFMLLMQRPLKQITVKSLCDLADINRGTFYAHYTDIYDLVHHLEQELIEISKNLVDYKYIGKKDQHNLYIGIFENIKNNIDDYKIVLLNPESIRCFDSLLTDAYEHHAAALRNVKGLSDNMIDYSFTFWKQGCIQVIHKWIENGMTETPSEMSRLIVDIIQNGIQLN